jgi:YegS/Rv2252/BmrU family lipid kinase
VDALVIVNPRAGGHDRGERGRQHAEAAIAAAASVHGLTARIVFTAEPGDGARATRDTLAGAPALVIAWGGDGTVNEVASVLAGTSVPLGIVPTGSGNGLGRELGIPREPRAALRVAFARQTRAIDVGTLGERLFVNVAGCGFDAQVAWRFSQGGHRRGLTRYVLFTLDEVRRYQAQHYRVTWDEGEFEGRAVVVTVANSRQFGNGALIAPLARVDDGWLDLVIVRPETPVRDLWRARKLFTGTLLQDAHVRWARVRRVRVQGEPALRAHVDGEPFDGPRELVAGVRPLALTVCTSRRAS